MLSRFKQLKDILTNFLIYLSPIFQTDQERRYKIEPLLEVLNEVENNYHNIPASSYGDILAPIVMFAKEHIELLKHYTG